MRDAARGLTARGMSLVAAGSGLGLGAWAFGQRDLLRVAVFLLLLPLLSVILVARSRFRLACSRSLESARVELGDSVAVSLTVANASTVPSGLLLVTDTMPRRLGDSPRLALDRIPSQGRRTARYAVTPTARGRFQVGPARVRLVDPFGLVSMTRSFTGVDQLLVTPRVHRLADLPLQGDWSGRGESRLRAMAAAGEDDILPRDYRVGDDLRRVHWLATARTGELMVRREERPWQSRATLVLDTRAAAHDREGFEWAMSAAASVAVHLAGRGWGIRLVGPRGSLLAADESAHAAGLLAALATVEPDPDPALGFADPAERRLLGDGLVIAVLGRTAVADAEALGRLRAGTATGLAILCDDDERVLADGLRRQGWRTAVAGPAVTPAQAWSVLRHSALEGVVR